eukprot:m.107835 g.107835  ORF g.107835 m.107835 type:complete len:69 (-) comp22600_c0_seq4:87-293(-)
MTSKMMIAKLLYFQPDFTSSLRASSCSSLLVFHMLLAFNQQLDWLFFIPPIILTSSLLCFFLVLGFLS